MSNTKKVKEIEPDLVSESDYGGMPLDEAINGSIRDLQAALNNIQQGLLTIIDHDEINHDEYAIVFSLGNEMVDLAKELKDIIKSFKPTGFKAALCKDLLDELNE